MFDKIITYSVKNKFIIGLFIAALTVWGLWSLKQLPIDAVPDITNNQVQIITVSPTLATQEIEQFITTPVELSLQNIQQLVEIRSISRFGLSVVTVVFEESMDIYLARQLVGEYLKEAVENIPDGLGSPELAPISTGLGEIYNYVVRPEEGYEDEFTPTDLRTIQDWIVKRQLSGIDGVVEVNTLGGFLKQYEVAVDPALLKSVGISISDIFNALKNSNENTGGAYIEKNFSTYYIRTNGIAKSLDDIGNIVITVKSGRPILIKDLAKVKYGKAPRYGALTRDGKEVVGGTVMMLKGENSADVTERIKERVIQIQKSLPKGVVIEPYLVRDKLVSTAIGTVKKNLIEGSLIVIFILILLLGNWRAGLIVASVIPLAMLFAVSMMNLLGISANLMSLGAIDFGLIIDGAVIIVEAISHRLRSKFANEKLTKEKMDDEVLAASLNIRSSAAFGEIIILIVYIPILALVGIEGKMFAPMAQTVMLALIGALILSLTYVPMMSALFMSKKISTKKNISDKIIDFFQKIYSPILKLAFNFKKIFVLTIIIIFAFSLYIFSRMGGEFIPTLEEGDFALHQILPPGSSLSQSIMISELIQDKLMEEFPEVEDIVTKIGSSEIPTDPMPVETGDIIVIMKPKSEWTSASTRKEMYELMEKSLQEIPGVGYEFSQPIQMRFNELMTGSRSDIAVKLYGDDLDLLYAKAKEAEVQIKNITGVATVNVEQTIGMPQILIDYKYDKMAQYGLQVKNVNKVVRAAFAGESAGIIYEGERRFDLIVRLDDKYRNDINSVRNLFINLENGSQVPLSSVAEINLIDSPMQISRDNTKRRIVIGVNIGDTDVETLVETIKTKLDKDLVIPSGYYFTYGGQFENLRTANARLMIAVPIAISLIFVLLFFTFGSISQALLIFTAIPLSAIGGIWALEIRGMPFSISAGIGFIALFGVAVLNGIVLIGYFNQLKKEGILDVKERILVGTRVRLRPVIMTAAVASFGFLPMAISTSGGAEVQRPLATVVIGGLLTATFLTLVIIPILYYWLEKWQERPKKGNNLKTEILMILIALGSVFTADAQVKPISLDEAIEIIIQNHPDILAADAILERESRLKSIRYEIGRTVITYKGDGLFKESEQLVNEFGLSQNFPSVKIAKANNDFHYQKFIKKTIEKKESKNLLIYSVKKLYFELVYKKNLKYLNLELIESYSKYFSIANSRLKNGESNGIDVLLLKTKIGEAELLASQLEEEIASLEKQLSTFLSLPYTITSTNGKDDIDIKYNNIDKNLKLQIGEQTILIEEAKVKKLESTLAPSYKLSFSAQNYFSTGWYGGLEAGISVPLFKKQYSKQIEAQKLNVDIARHQFEAAKISVQQELIKTISTIEKFKQRISFYSNQSQKINIELIRLIDLNYKAGELDFLELQNAVNMRFTTEKEIIASEKELHLAIAFYHYLTNKKYKNDK